jgi:hypothetical protein
MIFDVLLQFLLELVRALLVDELSGHVRVRIRQVAAKCGSRDIRRAILGVHRRNRNRLINKLITELEDDL